MKLVADNRHFPLLELLAKNQPNHHLDNGFDCYSSTELGLDRDKIVYFGLSVFWRASVHRWRLQDGQQVTIDLGRQYSEALRLYLLGAPVPKNITMMLIVCSDRLSQRSFLTPSAAGKQAGVWNYQFAGCGLMFWLSVGNLTTHDNRSVCFIVSPQHWIFRTNCQKTMVGFYSMLIEQQQRE
jgi:hypothetical protein